MTESIKNLWVKTWTFCSSRQDTVTRLCECWRYHQEEGFLRWWCWWLAGVVSCVNGSLASRLHHITICNTKLAVKLCQFLLKFDKIVSNET